eukprot:scaffold108511_cov33-Tisochrysis_lutea.AAC.4
MIAGRRGDARDADAQRLKANDRRLHCAPAASSRACTVPCCPLGSAGGFGVFAPAALVAALHPGRAHQPGLFPSLLLLPRGRAAANVPKL